jgi:hypothetical protein
MQRKRATERNRYTERKSVQSTRRSSVRLRSQAAQRSVAHPITRVELSTRSLVPDFRLSVPARSAVCTSYYSIASSSQGVITVIGHHPYYYSSIQPASDMFLYSSELTRSVREAHPYFIFNKRCQNISSRNPGASRADCAGTDGLTDKPERGLRFLMICRLASSPTITWRQGLNASSIVNARVECASRAF